MTVQGVAAPPPPGYRAVTYVEAYRVVFRVPAGIATRRAVECTGIPVAMLATPGRWRPWTGAGGVLPLPPRALDRVPEAVPEPLVPVAPVVIVVDAVTWTALPTRVRAAVRALVELRKIPGAIAVGPLGPTVAAQVRNVLAGVSIEERPVSDGAPAMSVGMSHGAARAAAGGVR